MVDKDRSKFFAHSFLRVKEGIVPDLSTPPLAVEKRLRELGRNFANKARFRQELVDYVRGNGELSSTLDRRGENSATARASPICGVSFRTPPALLTRLKSGARSSASPGPIGRTYRDVLVLSVLEFEILNGGLEQFFSNSSRFGSGRIRGRSG